MSSNIPKSPEIKTKLTTTSMLLLMRIVKALAKGTNSQKRYQRQEIGHSGYCTQFHPYWTAYYLMCSLPALWRISLSTNTLKSGHILSNLPCMLNSNSSITALLYNSMNTQRIKIVISIIRTSTKRYQPGGASSFKQLNPYACTMCTVAKCSSLGDYHSRIEYRHLHHLQFDNRGYSCQLFHPKVNLLPNSIITEQ